MVESGRIFTNSETGDSENRLTWCYTWARLENEYLQGCLEILTGGNDHKEIELVHQEHVMSD